MAFTADESANVRPETSIRIGVPASATDQHLGNLVGIRHVELLPTIDTTSSVGADSMLRVHELRVNEVDMFVKITVRDESGRYHPNRRHDPT
jgi:hypothetical protein